MLRRRLEKKWMGLSRRWMSSSFKYDGAEEIRVNRLLTQRKICSRREADVYIDKGYVLVDGQLATFGLKVRPGQNVEIQDALEEEQGSKRTILLHKPIGYVSAQPLPGKKPAIRLLEDRSRCWKDHESLSSDYDWLDGMAVCGRLDMESSGLLVFSQDGTIAKKLIGGQDIEKEYIVDVQGCVTTEKLQRLRNGSIELDGKPIRKAKVDEIDHNVLRFILREGKYRQIRRMCRAVDLHVEILTRVRIGRVHLGDLPIGFWRPLSPDEHF